MSASDKVLTPDLQPESSIGRELSSFQDNPESGASRIPFVSVLYERIEDRKKGEAAEIPDFFSDLNLDQIVDAIVADKEEYNLKPFFYASLNDIEAIYYRHQIMVDLQNKSLFIKIQSFSQKMKAMREQLVQIDKFRFKHQKDSYFLDAVEFYCDAINCLIQDLALVDLQSRGFLRFREYLRDYAESNRFRSLRAETERLETDLSTVNYCLLIEGNGFKVRKYEGEVDYSAEVEQTFEKFKQGEAKEYRVKFSNWPEMNHIEAKVLEFVAKLYADIFGSLSDYCIDNARYLDETVGIFDREIQFYIAYLEYVDKFKQGELEFCYPNVTCNKEIYSDEGFDLALANKLFDLARADKRPAERSLVVCNSFYLKDRERIFVVSGPNQGGKTTFSRTFGQLHFLASIGCPVPGKKAQLFLFDRIFTHFEKEENIHNLRGKLEDDLFRIHKILEKMTSNSIIIMNEIFTSTMLTDAIFLSIKVMEQIIERDSVCVCVTFIDEIALLGETIVSLVSTVVPENPALRTYRILRRPADGLAYAISIAEKYRLTYRQLKERLRR